MDPAPPKGLDDLGHRPFQEVHDHRGTEPAGSFDPLVLERVEPFDEAVLVEGWAGSAVVVVAVAGGEAVQVVTEEVAAEVLHVPAGARRRELLGGRTELG